MLCPADIRRCGPEAAILASTITGLGSSGDCDAVAPGGLATPTVTRSSILDFWSESVSDPSANKTNRQHGERQAECIHDVILQMVRDMWADNGLYTDGPCHQPDPQDGNDDPQSNQRSSPVHSMPQFHLAVA
jgi:hypothetical protein